MEEAQQEFQRELAEIRSLSLKLLEDRQLAAWLAVAASVDTMSKPGRVGTAP
jgi:hypothetical protein